MTEIKDVDREAAANFREYEMRLTVFPDGRSQATAICRKAELAEAFAAHREAAEKAERDRVVAWLREPRHGMGYVGRVLADKIERGEHLK